MRSAYHATFQFLASVSPSEGYEAGKRGSWRNHLSPLSSPGEGYFFYNLLPISYPRSSPDTKTEPTQGRTTRTVHGINPKGLADSIRSSGLTPAIQSNNRDVAQANYLGRCMVKEQSASIFAPLYSAAMTHNSHSRQTHTTLYSPN